ncbi:hypothetical protein ACFE04_015200 [Oxalis oulophora]
MNPTTTTTTDAPPPLTLQPHRPSTSCDRHSDESFTGFCPSCLFERLSVLDQSTTATTTSSRKPPTSSAAAAALKSIFKPSSSSATAPELRRTKSFSASKNEGLLGFVFEPQRKSCDVRLRNSLWNLFTIEDDRNPNNNSKIEVLGASSTSARPSVHEPVEEEVKTMKDHIDLDSQAKKRDFKDIAGSFWSAASVFSKKLQKWRQKQKLKKRGSGRSSIGSTSARLPVEKPIGRQFRETQSEIADYGFGRRSCDTDPRFSLDIGRISLDAGRMSLDAGRMSFDDPRYSFDEPRASWDGYLMGRTVPRMPTMLSVVEDGPAIGLNHVLRSDAQIPVEEPARLSITKSIDESDGVVPGGSVQTRDYYTDSSSRRRKSLDRSNSIRKTAAAVVAEIDELKSVSGSTTANSKVTPATSDNFYINGQSGQGPKVVVADLRDSYSNSLRDDCSETFEIPFRDNASVIGNGDRKGANNNIKKSNRWSKAWSILGFIHRRNVSRANGNNGVERSFSESWQGNGDVRGGFNNPTLSRSNSSVSWRNSSNFGSIKKDGLTHGHGKKKKDEFVLERNRSARYSPNNIENGLLRFYLTPLRGSRRGGSGKIRSNYPPSVARSVLRLY